MLICTAQEKCGYHADGGPEEKCPGMCDVEGCREETSAAGLGDMCVTHEFLTDMGFDMEEFAKLTEGYSPAVIVRESVKRTLAALRRVSERI